LEIVEGLSTMRCVYSAAVVRLIVGNIL
jgi:hypothetical protein